MNIIDLFSGAGGLTEGFRHDYNVIGHVEKELPASETLKLRDTYYYLQKNGNVNLYYDFLKNKISNSELLSHIPENILDRTINEEISDNTLKHIFKQLDSILLNEQNQEVSGVIGGPPCQAYSTIGRALNASKKATDGRIYLYRYYIDFLNKYNPTFFVFENVKGLLSFKDTDDDLLFPKMQQEFRDAGYELDYRLINTVDYGVPQSRERIIIFGTTNDKKYLIPNFFDKLETLKESPISVNTAFTGLPKLHSGEQNNTYTSETNSFVKEMYQQNMNIPLTQNISRPNNQNDLEIYKIVAKNKQNGVNIKYNELSKNLITHTHTDKFLDRYKALSWELPSHTVVAHIAKDGHHYIHPDPQQNRSITVREAARLQGFPDDFFFETSRTAAFTQIGNAVPPILSEKIANTINEIIH
ncbi:DNA cytosine methyltransferase [Lactiplantibacillus plantarum]|uniref:DNA cytosine methyltransferase n=1 Tax=Lactiplantibacillus plantarum TaxID=1590 RepID=UPI0023786B27|nr:DNA cytosine methyltransferase [Lactiplantibacillus plantarum]WDQ20901.1 DNA cytosine methyltransferase [Lactiplantibacillus plantarum]